MRYGYGHGGQVEPKPFAFVDIKGTPERREYVPHDKYRDFTGKLELTIEVISDYLFVGSGNYDFRERDKLVYYSFFRTNGGIAIPGTSIKGAVRSVAEAISNSCVSQLAGRKRTGKNRYKQDERLPPYIDKKHSHKPCDDINNLCPVCRLFGTTGYGGRVSFLDASLAAKPDIEIIKIGELFGPTNVTPERNAPPKRKFYQNKKFNPVKPESNYRFVEAVRKGSKFLTTVGFQNVTEAELSLLLHAMGIGQAYRIKIGGAKPRCFGTVSFIAGNFKGLSADLLSFEEKSVSEVMMNEDLIKTELLEQFIKEISKEEEFCPKEMY